MRTASPQVNGNAYVSTKASGAANVNEAASGNAGSVSANSLEASTVDLATEFTNLITTQRAYSASARIITTANEMLQVLEDVCSDDVILRGKARKTGLSDSSGTELSEAFIGSFTTVLGPF